MAFKYRFPTNLCIRNQLYGHANLHLLEYKLANNEVEHFFIWMPLRFIQFIFLHYCQLLVNGWENALLYQRYNVKWRVFFVFFFCFFSFVHRNAFLHFCWKGKILWQNYFGISLIVCDRKLMCRLVLANTGLQFNLRCNKFLSSLTLTRLWVYVRAEL